MARKGDLVAFTHRRRYRRPSLRLKHRLGAGAYYSGILTALRLDHHEELVQTNPG